MRLQKIVAFLISFGATCYTTSDFFYAEKIFSGTECIKQIYTVPEVNWSLGSLDKAEVSSSNSLSISAIRRGSRGAMFPVK